MYLILKFIFLISIVHIGNSDDVHEQLIKPKENRKGAKVFSGVSLDDFFKKRPEGPKQEQDASFWFDKSQESIRSLLRCQNLPIRATNVILFIGDGMSLPTVTAARIFKGQQQGGVGETSNLSFEKFRNTGITKTYCVDAQVPDSACTATAYFSGVKTNFFALGVNAKTSLSNCSSAMEPSNHVDSIVSWAQKAGKSTGIVTTTTVTHASPGGGYAHIANRLYESDADVKMFGEDPTTCTDIARQLIENSPGRNLDVVMGGGRLKFFPNTEFDSLTGESGDRLDNRNLIKEWQKNNPKGNYVKTREELLSLNMRTTSKIFGQFNTKNLQFNLLRDKEVEPSLEEMTESAIKVLSKNPRGYFLFVEGGRIDHGHHATVTRLALDETLEFEKAIQKARDLTSPMNTLIVVTSDHSHTMSMAGYPNRNNDILGLNDHELDDDNIAYLTLNYANGPEQYLDPTGKRLNLTEETVQKLSFKHPGYARMSIETHGGDDVAVFADGPYSHFFSGVYEQSDIPHKMAFASCIGSGITHCRRYPVRTP